MREHMGLFRGKRLSNGEWVEGNLLAPNEVFDNWCISCVDYLNEHGDIGCLAREVDPATIGECTSLKDRNGKLVFEGDIVRICDRGHCAEGIIVFENAYPGGWLVADMFYKHKCSLAMRTDVEIIGTVHDNPELLKGGEGE